MQGHSLTRKNATFVLILNQSCLYLFVDTRYINSVQELTNAPNLLLNVSLMPTTPHTNSDANL